MYETGIYTRYVEMQHERLPSSRGDFPDDWAAATRGAEKTFEGVNRG